MDIATLVKPVVNLETEGLLELKTEFFMLLSEYKSSKGRYYRAVDAVEGSNLFNGINVMEHLSHAVEQECAKYEARLTVIKSQVEPSIMAAWLKEYKYAKTLAEVLTVQ